jgi:hypothetical protein
MVPNLVAVSIVVLGVIAARRQPLGRYAAMGAAILGAVALGIFVGAYAVSGINGSLRSIGIRIGGGVGLLAGGVVGACAAMLGTETSKGRIVTTLAGAAAYLAAAQGFSSGL